MENESDWIFVEKEDELVDQLSTSLFFEKDQSDMINKSTYVDVLLKNVEQDKNPQRTNSSIGQKKTKPIKKRNDDQESIDSYVEPKPGSQYRNSRSKAGKNKVHKGRSRTSSPPKNIGNSSKVGCSFCNPKLSNRVQRQRNIRQQCSDAKWKDYDY